MRRTCKDCGRVNRVPIERLADRARCGECKALLDPVDRPLDVNTAELDAIVAAARVPVLVDFWAAWCLPCRIAAPRIAEVAREAAGRALVLKVNTERNREVISRYGIRGIPNFVVFRRGKLVHQKAGLLELGEMLEWLAPPESHADADEGG